MAVVLVAAVATTATAAWEVVVVEVAEVAVAVNSTFPMSVPPVSPILSEELNMLTINSQLPFNVGWQDLKDLFRGAGMMLSLA